MTVIEQQYDWKYDPGRRTATQYIVLHHAAGNGDVQAIHRYHRDGKGWAGIAYHYYVRKDGSVYRGRPEDWNGGHTEGYNKVSIGVCFEGNFNAEPMGSAQQLAAGRALLAELRARFPDAKVVLHRDLNETACPGTLFPVRDMTDDVAAEQPSPWAADAVKKWIDMELLRGDGEGHYGFQEPVTTERMIVLIERRLAHFFKQIAE